ncbi:Rho GTPase-activating protein 21 [Taenia solium]|eukprot:TsM_000717400 transcript=TsM_000717400 gene=TsM_000717400
MSGDSRLNRCFRRRLTSFLKTTLTAGISSHSPLTSSPRTDVASPPPRKIKRKSLVPRIRCLDSEPTRSSACSSVTSMSFRKSLNAWRRRRPTRRDSDLHLAKNADLFRNAEASRLSRCRLLEGFAHETLNAKSELYKSEECLCKVTKIDGKTIIPAIWSRFYVYIGNGFVRFRSASSDYHNSKKSTPGRFCLDDSSMVNDVDPPTPSSISSSYIVLPLQGLQWSSLRYLPSDLPTWGSSSSSAHRLHRLSSVMLESEANAASGLQCYFFEHEDNGGTQIIVIFPNNQAAASTLSVCQQFGGVCTENNPPDSSGLSYSLSLHTGLAAYHPSPDRGGGRGALRRTRKSLPDSAVRRRFAADFSHQEGKRARGGPLHSTKNPTTVTTTDRSVNTDDAVGVDGTSRFRFLSSAAAPFFKGIVNALSNSRAPPTLPNSAPPPPPSSPEELAHRIAAVIGEPPDLSDLNNPGPVFGAPLESQIPSPDYPNVPLILHALVMALELHGLHHVGLYRAPGRQKEINRFVCLANLTSLDPNVMLHLDTWRDIRALTGVIKIFFRRLPEPIFDPVLWGPLASIVPESPEEYDKVSLAYMLLAILPKLDKIRSAFVPLTSTNTSHRVNNTKYEKVMPTWPFATLDFLFGHLRRLVALEEANQCSFGCIAICFGPTLFRGDSPLQPKFNKLLEVMLQHWPWLVAETANDLDDTDHSNSSRHPDLAQTEAYAEQFFDNGTDFDVLTAVEDIFTRAGMSVGPISRSESMKSINKNYDEDGSLLDIIMRSLSASSDFDDQKLASSPIFEGEHNAIIEQQRGCDKLDEASSSSPSMQRTDF